jgi:hypothetical protein
MGFSFTEDKPNRFMKPSFFPLSLLGLALAAMLYGFFHMSMGDDFLLDEREVSESESPVIVRRETLKTPQASIVHDAKIIREKRTSSRPKYVIQTPLKLEAKVVSQTRREELKRASPRISSLWWNERGEEPSIKEKHAAILKFGKNFTPIEREALYDYIRSGPDDNAFDLEIIDTVMIHLDGIPSLASEYVTEMIGIVQDKSVDGSVRGYVMQHLGDSYQTTPALRFQINEALNLGLSDLSTDVSGTSALVLTTLSQQYDHFDRDLIGQAAMKVVEDESTSHNSRISAVSAVGRLGVVEALPIVRKQAQEGDRIVMKLAAIHSLGQIGDAEDIELLENILKDKSKQVLAIAAKKALSHIKERI